MRLKNRCQRYSGFLGESLFIRLILEITPQGLFGGYPNGKVQLPSNDSELISYLEKVIALNPGNAYLQERLEKLLHPAVPELLEEGAEPAGDPDTAEPGFKPVPICGTS